MENIWINVMNKKVLVLKILLLCALATGLVFAWIIGYIAISFGSVNPMSMIAFWSLFLLSFEE